MIHFIEKLKNHTQILSVFVALFLLAVWLFPSFIMDPKYQASSQLLIEEKGRALQEVASHSNRLDPQAIEAFAAFVKSPKVLEELRADLKFEISLSDLQKQITVNHSSDSPVLTITAFSDSGQQSVEIANSLSSIFQHNVSKNLDTASIRIILQAVEARKANIATENWVLGLVAATILGFIFKLLAGYISTSAKASAEIRKDARKKENQLQTVFK